MYTWRDTISTRRFSNAIDYDYPFDLDLCYYCGDYATTVDHVVPQVVRKMLEDAADPNLTDSMMRLHTFLVVPACKECNCVLSSSYQVSLAERRKELECKPNSPYILK